MEEPPFLSERHPGSNRWAVFEDDGRTGWLYITEPVFEEGTPCA